MNGTCVGTYVQLTFVIHQQLTYKNMSNSVHNCESCSCMNCQGNELIVHVRIRKILLTVLTIVVICCSVSQLYKYKWSGNKVPCTTYNSNHVLGLLIVFLLTNFIYCLVDLTSALAACSQLSVITNNLSPANYLI